MKNSRTRIKICGLTRKDDVDHALSLGVDALGFVFYPPSKRYLSPSQAAQITKHLPVFTSTVALFVDPAREHVDEVVQTMRPTCLQFHGDESPAFCASFRLPYIKAFRVGAPGLDTPDSIAIYCSAYSEAAGWLYDSYTAAYGGSGQGFDYTLLSRILNDDIYARSLILSGGLNAQNVANAIGSIGPWAVDVSSGVEHSPGLKDPDKMSAFVSAIRLADS